MDSECHVIVIDYQHSRNILFKRVSIIKLKKRGEGVQKVRTGAKIKRGVCFQEKKFGKTWNWNLHN